MEVRQIIRDKGDKVVTMRPSDSIDTLVRRLRLEGIGAVVVSTDGATIEGIISERDVVRGLAEHGAELPRMTVSDLMTKHVRTCSPADGVKDLMHMMTQYRIRHLPVMEQGRLVGIVSIGDIVKSRLADMEMEANVLRDYAVAHR